MAANAHMFSNPNHAVTVDKNLMAEIMAGQQARAKKRGLKSEPSQGVIREECHVVSGQKKGSNFVSHSMSQDRATTQPSG